MDAISFGHNVEYDTMKYVARALGWSLVMPDAASVSCGTLRKVSLALACTKRCVPLVFNRNRVVLVVDDPLHGLVLTANPQLIGPPYRRRLEIALTTPGRLDALLEKRRTLVQG